MNARKLIALSLTLLFLMLTAPPPAKAATASVQIRPELELLAGVIAYSSWEYGKPMTSGNDYYQALKAYLEPYREHEAMLIYEELLGNPRLSFSYDAPPNFIFHLGPLPDLELKHEYSPSLLPRAGGRENLERFRLALKQLAADSEFHRFTAEWQPHYAEWIRAADLDTARILGWMEGFFGYSAGSEYHLVLAPALMPDGGYGPRVQTAQGDTLVYQVVRAKRLLGAEPIFPKGEHLELLALHEWGHSWVNPALERHPRRVRGLLPYFTPVREKMRQQAYPDLPTYANELVIRSIVALGAYDLHGPSLYARVIAEEKSYGFAPIEQVVALLREYQANRETYPTFDDFVPYLLTELTREAPRGSRPVWPWAAGGAAALTLLAGLLIYRRTRRQTAA